MGPDVTPEAVEAYVAASLHDRRRESYEIEYRRNRAAWIAKFDKKIRALVQHEGLADAQVEILRDALLDYWDTRARALMDHQLGSISAEQRENVDEAARARFKRVLFGTYEQRLAELLYEELVW